MKRNVFIILSVTATLAGGIIFSFYRVYDQDECNEGKSKISHLTGKSISSVSKKFFDVYDSTYILPKNEGEIYRKKLEDVFLSRLSPDEKFVQLEKLGVRMKLLMPQDSGTTIHK
jgi:hypothetical protein